MEGRPEIVGSTQLVIEKVAGDPGAISYIDEADLDGSSNKSVSWNRVLVS